MERVGELFDAKRRNLESIPLNDGSFQWDERDASSGEVPLPKLSHEVPSDSTHFA